MARRRVSPLKGKTYAQYRIEHGHRPDVRMSVQYPSERWRRPKYQQRSLDEIRADLAQQLEQIVRKWEQKLAG